MIRCGFVLLCVVGLFSETLCTLLEAETGENVTIWCKHEQTVTSSIFWFKHTNDSVPLLIGCKKFRASAPTQNCYFYNNTERMMISVQGEKTSLTITALNISDTGLYYCSTVEADQIIFRNSTYLHVKDLNKTFSENLSARTNGCFYETLFFVLNAVFGSVIAILLGVLIFIFILCLKHRKTHGGAETEDREDRDSGTLHYAALKFTKKNKKNRKKQDDNMVEHVVYSSVKRRDECM